MPSVGAVDFVRMRVWHRGRLCMWAEVGRASRSVYATPQTKKRCGVAESDAPAVFFCFIPAAHLLLADAAFFTSNARMQERKRGVFVETARQCM